MIASCSHCGRLYETTEEEAGMPLRLCRGCLPEQATVEPLSADRVGSVMFAMVGQRRVAPLDPPVDTPLGEQIDGGGEVDL